MRSGGYTDRLELQGPKAILHHWGGGGGRWREGLAPLTSPQSNFLPSPVKHLSEEAGVEDGLPASREAFSTGPAVCFFYDNSYFLMGYVWGGRRLATWQISCGWVSLGMWFPWQPPRLTSLKPIL